MSLSNAVGGNTLGLLTQTLGTVINALVPASRLGRAVIASLLYLCAGTAHTLTFLRAIGRCGITQATAAAGTVIYIDRNPGPTGDGSTGSADNNNYPQGVTANLLVASDLIVIRETDGVQRVYTVSAVDTTNPLKVTLTGALTAGVDAKSTLWMLGVLADVDPSYGLAHPTRLAVVSVVNTYSGNVSGVHGTYRDDEPILVQSNNATAAGSFNSVEYAYQPVYK